MGKTTEQVRGKTARSKTEQDQEEVRAVRHVEAGAARQEGTEKPES
jgi:hypothetical protein